jgi:hypothetical protein
MGGFVQRLQQVSNRVDAERLLTHILAVPTMLSTFVVTVFIVLFLDTPKSRHGAYRPPEAGVLVSHPHSPTFACQLIVFNPGNSVVQRGHDADFPSNGNFDLPVRSHVYECSTRH